MKIKTATFVTSALSHAACPPANLPEFAFIGRSNVGKSSLLNLLVGQAGLAKVSATPGHTRMINFFRINEAWLMVDLPGYGYAKTVKRDPQQFQVMVADYLAHRETLRRVLVLIDARLDPQQIDLEFVAWLVENGLRFALVFTKTDKVKKTALAKNVAAFQEKISGWATENPPVFITSAETRAGKSELLAFLDAVLREVPEESEDTGELEESEESED